MKPTTESGWVTCLGHWCGHKKFFSNDRAGKRYCKKCSAKKDAAERNLPGIKICGIMKD